MSQTAAKILVAVLAAAGAALLIWLATSMRRRRQIPQPQPPCAVIHTVDFYGGTNPCPPGYRLEKGLFTQADGSKRDGYVAQDGRRISIDYLMPGEGVSIPIETRFE